MKQKEKKIIITYLIYLVSTSFLFFSGIHNFDYGHNINLINHLGLKVKDSNLFFIMDSKFLVTSGLAMLLISYVLAVIISFSFGYNIDKIIKTYQKQTIKEIKP